MTPKEYLKLIQKRLEEDFLSIVNKETPNAELLEEIMSEVLWNLNIKIKD